MKTAQFQYSLSLTHDTYAVHTVRVTLLPNRKRYLAYCRSKSLFNASTGHWEPMSGCKTAAKMLTFSPEQVQNGDPNAECVFYQCQFTPDCIAHEACHVTCAFFRSIGKTIDTDEELFAHLTGQLAQAILEWRRDLLK